MSPRVKAPAEVAFEDAMVELRRALAELERAAAELRAASAARLAHAVRFGGDGGEA